MSESDPTGKSPHELGAKLDAGKAPVDQGVTGYFPRALLAVSQVSAFGATKYAWNGWEHVEDGINRYSNAMGRHILHAAEEGGFEGRAFALDPESKLLHSAHIAWNALATLELILRKIELEDCEVILESDPTKKFVDEEHLDVDIGPMTQYLEKYRPDVLLEYRAWMSLRVEP